MRSILKSAIFFTLISLPAMAQISERARLQAELDDLSTTLARLHKKQQLLSAQADSLAEDIQRLKSKTPSLLQERTLDGMLRFSQILADSLQTSQARAQRIDSAIRQKTEVLLKILNSDIARLVKQGEELKRNKNVNQREEVARVLIQYREWQRRCQEWLEQPPPAIIIYQVEARPDDAPETIRRKADFLRDQADRLRREVKRLDAKISDIRDETQVRRRVADLATDLSLLDPNREGVSNPASGNLTAEALGVDDRGARNSMADFANTSNSQLPIYQNWPAQLGDLSFDDLEKWRGKLERQKKQRQVQADSLVQRAVEIEKLMTTPNQTAGEKHQ